MKTTPAGNLKDYNGPRSHKAILEQIYKEALESGKEVSPNFIGRVITFFFSGKGFPSLFKIADSFSIAGIGRFLITKEGRKYFKRKKRIWERNNRRMIVRIYRKKNAKQERHYKYLWIKIDFDNRNIHLKSIGWKELTWREYCTIKRFFHGQKWLISYPEILAQKSLNKK